MIYDELKKNILRKYITNFYRIANTSRLLFMSSCIRRRKYDFKSDDYLVKKELRQKETKYICAKNAETRNVRQQHNNIEIDETKLLNGKSVF